LEDEKRAREAALTQDRRRAEATNDMTQLRLLEAQQRDELARRTVELESALEEARRAREAAKVAEQQRLAAVTLAEAALRQRDLLALRQALQEQLKRVGCYEGPIDGDWGANAKQAMANFAKFTITSFSGDQPTEEILTVVTSKPGRVCIPTCFIPGE